MKFKKSSNIISLVAIILLFIIITTITYMHPLYPDDYNYAFIFGSNVRIDSLKDMIESSRIFYLDWGGRVLPFFLGQLMICWGREVFSFLNGGLFITLAILIYRICFKKKGDKIDFRKLLLVIFLIVIGIPAFAETVFWEIGSINYLWMMVLTLLYMYPYLLSFLEKIEIKDEIKSCVLISIVAFFAGMTNENIVPFGIFATIVYLIYVKVVRKNIQKWNLFGLFFYLLGSGVLMLSPGNEKRATVEYSAYNISSDFFTRIKEIFWPSFKHVIGNEYRYILLIYIFVVVAFLLQNGYKNKEFILSMLLGLAALGTNIIMIFPSTYSARAAFGGAIFIIMGICLLISKLNITEKKLDIVYSAITFVVIVALVKIFSSTVKSAIDYNEKYTNLIQYVNYEKDKGNLDIVTEPIHINHTRFFDGFELTTNKDNLQNIYFAKFYEINSIVIKE